MAGKINIRQQAQDAAQLNAALQTLVDELAHASPIQISNAKLRCCEKADDFSINAFERKIIWSRLASLLRACR